MLLEMQMAQKKLKSKQNPQPSQMQVTDFEKSFIENQEDNMPLRTGLGENTDRSVYDQVTRRELIKNKSGSIMQESPFKDTSINDNTVDEDHLKLEKEKLRKKKATKNALRRAHRGDPSNFNDFNNDPLSKIYKYYTGDDMEEFEEDLLYENLAALSEEEFTTKESAKKREGKQRKVH